MKRELRQLGMSHRETEVYLALLKAGDSSITQLAHKSNVPRTSLYSTLAGLHKKGFVTKSRRNKQVVYRVEEPAHLVDVAEQSRDLWQERMSSLKNIVPQLESMASQPNSPWQVTVYENPAGSRQLREIFFAALRKHKVGYQIVDSTKFREALGGDFVASKLTARRRQIQGSKMFIIENDNPMGKKFAAQLETDFREIRFLPHQQDLPATFMVCGDKVLIVSLEQPFYGVLLEGEGAASFFLTLFKSLWASLPSYTPHT